MSSSSRLSGLLLVLLCCQAVTIFGWGNPSVRQLLGTCATSAYAQCGGLECPGPYTCADAAGACCPAGYTCTRGNAYYWQCTPSPSTAASTPAATTAAAAAATPAATTTATPAATTACIINPCPPKLVDTALFLLLECEPTSPNGPAAMLTTAKNPSAEGLFSLSVMLVCKVLGL